MNKVYQALISITLCAILLSALIAANPNTPGTPAFRLAASTNTTNATNVKTTAGTLWNVTAINTLATVAYIKFYDETTAPTVGTDVPVFVVPLAVSNAVTTVTFPQGLRFNNGISYAVTGGMADSDTTVVAANQVTFSGTYQ